MSVSLEASGSHVRVERVASFDALRAEWQELANRVGGIFATWEWADAWWQTYGHGRELALYACRAADGRLAAIVPLYVWRRRPRVLRFVGHGPGDELGPIFAAGDHTLAAAGMRHALHELDWAIVFAEQLPGQHDWPQLLSASPWRREASPILEIPGGDADAWLASRSANFRQQQRRRRRALDELGSVEFRLSQPATLEDDLDTLFRLHALRFSGERSDFADCPLHRALARTAAARGWLRLWILELDGRSVAAWHGFHVAGITSYYQAGRDPAFERAGVGGVLLMWTIRAAIEEGATEYRLGRGAEAYKSRFASADPGLVTVSLERGIFARAAVSSLRAVRSARSRLR